MYRKYCSIQTFHLFYIMMRNVAQFQSSSAKNGREAVELYIILLSLYINTWYNRTYFDFIFDEIYVKSLTIFKTLNELPSNKIWISPIAEMCCASSLPEHRQQSSGTVRKRAAAKTFRRVSTHIFKTTSNARRPLTFLFSRSLLLVKPTDLYIIKYTKLKLSNKSTKSDEKQNSYKHFFKNKRKN